jgi:hypothetical protein
VGANYCGDDREVHYCELLSLDFGLKLWKMLSRLDLGCVGFGVRENCD